MLSFSHFLVVAVLAFVITGCYSWPAADIYQRRFMASACDNFCADKAAGLYANPCDITCSTFFNCANGITAQQSCASGLRFNATLKVCDWPDNVQCSSNPSTSPSPSNKNSPPPQPPSPKKNSPSPPPASSKKSPSPPPASSKKSPPPPPASSKKSPPPPPNPRPQPPGFLFSPYKDITINLDGNTNVISTSITGTRRAVTSVMPSNLRVLTWAFATGDCSSETWAGVSPSTLVAANVNTFITAGKQYIISTGGAAGVFRCGSDTNFINFLKRYNSSAMIGVDFDIEGGQSQSEIEALVQRVKAARTSGYGNLRYSFTVATLGGTTGNQLNSLGSSVINALKNSQMGWSGIYINLMVMDYGGNNCAVSSTTGKCDMGQSAINAAKALNSYWSVPYSSIELTPMIGGNDVIFETFTLQDLQTMSAFVKDIGISGVHFWSLDRDVDCSPGAASPTCNSYGKAGPLGFTNQFLSSLGM